MRGRTAVDKIHASVSGFHSGSSFGDDESIDRNNANTNKTPAMAAANIGKDPPSGFLVSNCRATIPALQNRSQRGSGSRRLTEPRPSGSRSAPRCKLHKDPSSGRPPEEGPHRPAGQLHQREVADTHRPLKRRTS